LGNNPSADSRGQDRAGETLSPSGQRDLLGLAAEFLRRTLSLEAIDAILYFVDRTLAAFVQLCNRILDADCRPYPKPWGSFPCYSLTGIAPLTTASPPASRIFIPQTGGRISRYRVSCNTLVVSIHTPCAARDDHAATRGRRSPTTLARIDGPRYAI